MPIAFTLFGAGIVLNLFFTEARNALLGSGVLLLGVPVYFLWRRVGRRQG